jgi:large repetitive protein
VAALVTATALSLALSSGAYASKAVHVSCGQKITQDTRLANDLTDCTNNGLVIGADDITLDLNGHTIDGDGLDNLVEGCPDFHCDIGIDNTAHHHGITIQDGAVQEFSSGIWIEGGADHRLRRLSVSRNADGIDVALAADTVVTQSSVEGNVFGIWIGRSDNIRIERNTVLDYQGCGVEVQNSDHLLIEPNSVSSNDPGAPLAGDACGIGLFNGSARSRIERNSVSGNGFVAVIVEHGDDNEVTGNHIFRNNAGVILDGDRNTISRNRVSDVLGSCDGCGVGISFEGGHDNLIAGNTVERTREAGIRLAAFEPFTPPAVDNAAQLNTVRGARLDGILVDATAVGTLLARNTATGNADDGIDVDSESTRLVGNTANRNQDLGVEAVPGVTDGGGNRAGGNGNPLQCTNVFCR